MYFSSLLLINVCFLFSLQSSTGISVLLSQKHRLSFCPDVISSTDSNSSLYKAGKIIISEASSVSFRLANRRPEMHRVFQLAYKTGTLKKLHQFRPRFVLKVHCKVTRARQPKKMMKISIEIVPV